MRTYKELDLNERVKIQQRLEAGESLRAIARSLGRAPSTISRECVRMGATESYGAQAAHRCAQRRRVEPRVARKLSDPRRFGEVCTLLRRGWSPQQVAGKLREAYPDEAFHWVSHETIYSAIYVLPRGELRRQLVACLRQRRSARKPRRRSADGRGRIPEMQSIHVRPPEVADRLILGHWEGDLIKGAGNRSSIGTLVERTSGFVVLVKMSSASAADALDSFSAALERIPEAVRRTLTYDRGKEMSYHAALTLRTGVAVYFADPHSPWQRGRNENTNGLLRQYLPKGTDLSVHRQHEFNQIALSLNPCRAHNTSSRRRLRSTTGIYGLRKLKTVRCINYCCAWSLRPARDYTSALPVAT